MESKRDKEEKDKMKIAPHMCLWPFLQIYNLGHFSWFRWFGNVTKQLRITFESR
jgi:hypothetical protein